MNRMFDFAQVWLYYFTPFVLAYFILLNSIYMVLTLLASIDFTRYLRRVPFAGHDDVFANPLTPGVSVIVPAYNEEAGIVDAVRAMLSLRFPLFEVVVVDDGSKDGTLARLTSAFDLVEVPFENRELIPLRGAIKSVYVARSGEPVVVVSKENGGSSGDSTNAGIGVARHPLICMVDADSLLESEALLRVVKPFVDDPEHVVATGGVVRPANGCVVESGLVTRASLPRSWLGRIQVVEYLRSFLLGRTGWSAMAGLLVISGAFAVFRRDLVLEMGGMDAGTMGQDAEFVARMHHYMRRNRRKRYRMVFVSEPVCWTEVPEQLSVLRRQRKRWSRGLAEVLWKHRRMMFNPRYGRIGCFVLPYYLFFELLGPVVELAGVAVMLFVMALWGMTAAAGTPILLVDSNFAILFWLVALGYGFLLSIAALAVEEMSFHRMNSRRDLAASLFASLFENVGYRQLHCLWRFEGLVWWIRQRNAKWGDMPRSGFVAPGNPPAEGLEPAVAAELAKR